MSEVQFTTVDRIIGKLHRDLRGTTLNETDVIEWIGEALGHLKVPQIQEQAVHFVKVENYEATMPSGFHAVLQIARNNRWTGEEETKCGCIDDVEQQISQEEPANTPVVINCQGELSDDAEYAYYRPTFDLVWEYHPWTSSTYYRENFSPVRLANNTLFGTLVCKEKIFQTYSGEDEYTIVGLEDKKFRFSFETGQVAISYLKNAVDTKTGYPLVPDDISDISAVVYYVKWKIAEWYDWNGREGFSSKALDNERKWNKYVKQAKNKKKMPKTIDQYQNLLEASHQLIPRNRRYYGFFGSLGRIEDRKFNNANYDRDY